MVPFVIYTALFLKFLSSKLWARDRLSLLSDESVVNDFVIRPNGNSNNLFTENLSERRV